MDKFKFYILKIHLDCNDVSNLLTANNDEFYGIKFIKEDQNYLKFNFYERKILETTYIDKNFNEQVIEHLKTDDFHFYIFNYGSISFLALENPSRNISFFKNFLSQKLDNKISVIGIELNPLALFEFLRDIKDLNFTVASLEVKDLQLSTSTIATLTMKSSENLFSIFQDFLQTDKYIVSKTILMSSSKFKGKLLLSNDCSLSLQIHQQDEFLDLFLLFLRTHLNQNQ
ncbi:hypothetical protein ACK1JC_13915 [Acinetobacter sp. TY2]|uniref:hypothetical protein n=1 Tax=Acinetobacter sp. TY2 TaxID=3387403 RepID=UPI0039178819